MRFHACSRFSATPRLAATSVTLHSPRLSTSRTASRLNSSVYFLRFAISMPPYSRMTSSWVSIESGEAHSSGCTHTSITCRPSSSRPTFRADSKLSNLSATAGQLHTCVSVFQAFKRAEGVLPPRPPCSSALPRSLARRRRGDDAARGRPDIARRTSVARSGGNERCPRPTAHLRRAAA